MGFMGGIFKALGFESENNGKKKKTVTKTKASYKLKSNKNNRVDDIDGVSVYYPESVEQAKEFIEFVKQNKAIIISTESCQGEISLRIVDFMKGFCFGSNSRFIVLNEDKLYLILPEGMEIEE